VASGRFRLDLFYRLNVIPIVVPAVRERKDCILPLVRHYLDLFGERHGIHKRLTRAASDALLAYSYPGNVRELMNICERLVVMSETELIDISDLPSTIVERVGGVECDLLEWPEGMTLTQICASIERTVLLRTASRHVSQAAVATALGVSQPTVARRLQKYGIKLSSG
jgi:transcriptional regulator with PAS, ATPase and Fis domain